MKKRTKILTIVLSCVAACAVGVAVFCVLFFGKSKGITPPSDNLSPADREIAQRFELTKLYEDGGFKQIGWKVSRANENSDVVSNGKLIVPQSYRGLPILQIGNAFNGWTEIEQVVFSEKL